MREISGGAFLKVLECSFFKPQKSIPGHLGDGQIPEQLPESVRTAITSRFVDTGSPVFGQGTGTIR
jgi:hypothetical protein